MKKILTTAVLVLSCLSASAQKVWEPTAVWPFAFKTFQPATVYTGLFKATKNMVPCNIHLGKHALWFSQNDTLMEATSNIYKIVFKNGDIYVPIQSGELGKVLREDTINGRIARLIQIWEPDQKRIDEKEKERLHMNQLAATGFGGSYLAQAAESLDRESQEGTPMPMTSQFYFFIKGEFYLAKETNIIKIIGKERKKEYLNFTRSAEIISTSPTSMMKVWDNFIAPQAK